MLGISPGTTNNLVPFGPGNDAHRVNITFTYQPGR